MSQEAPKIPLDYSLKTCEERSELVNKIVAAAPAQQLTPHYLEILADYVLDAVPKEEAAASGLMTKNRMVTVNKRETSLEGLAEKFENGEDGIYSLMTEDKNILLQPKNTITEKDIAEVPGLAELRAAIESVKASEAAAMGRRKFLLKKQLIEMYKDQYVLRDAYRMPMQPRVVASRTAPLDLTERRWVDEKGEPHSDGLISFFNPDHISAILCNYSGLKNETAGKYQSDMYYLMEDFDKLLRRALEDQPLYQDIIRLKVGGAQNSEIQDYLLKNHGTRHTVEYISALWRRKIPQLIAEYAENEYLLWYYKNEAPELAKWKRCSRCGQLKLAHNRFFSKNKSSRDGFYSICKCCRNKKAKTKE